MVTFDQAKSNGRARPSWRFWSLEEVIRQDYIRTARAKGVPPGRVIWHHAFRNTLIPLVTLMGLTLPSLLSGAVILLTHGNYWLDAAVALAIALVVAYHAIRLMRRLLADLREGSMPA